MDEQTLAKRRVEAYRMGRKKRGDIRVFVLWSLTERPMHGYELIQFLTEKTYGTWVPSPGSVYPTLQSLEEQGMVTSEEKDGKKVYTITDAGRTAAEELPKGGLANDPEQYDAIRQLREANMLIRRTMRAIITRGSLDDLQQTAAIMNETRTKLIAVFDKLPK